MTHTFLRSEHLCLPKKEQRGQKKRVLLLSLKEPLVLKEVPKVVPLKEVPKGALKGALKGAPKDFLRPHRQGH
jgi:hypothetical protein